MTDAKRPRGRPKGDGVDDAARLARVADLLIARPALSPSSAMKQTEPPPGQADLRRLQSKWHLRKDALLAAARQRLKDRQDAQAARSAARRSGGPGYGATEALQRQLRQLDRLTELACGGLAEDAVSRAARGLAPESVGAATRAAEAAAFRFGAVQAQIDAVENSPVMRAARGLIDDPVQRHIRRIEDSPTMRLARQMEDSPTLRLAREMKRLGLT